MKINKQIKKVKRPMPSKNYIRFLIFLGMLAAGFCQAKDLGVWGATFPVIEHDMKEFIYARLNNMKQNGELEKIKEKFIQNAKAHILRPNPVLELTTTQEPKTFYHDPTYVLDKDIKDDKGRIIAKSGTTINPFDTVKLSGILFFFNADDKRQVLWAIENGKKYDYVKYVLIRGNIKEAGEVLRDRIYFDQYGLITQSLGIKHIPCIVKQSDKKLQIQEFSFKKVSEKNDLKERSRTSKEKK